MNNKGFTLVELLAVMAIIAIISVIAVPNVVRIMDDNQKDKMINDAQSVIALAKYQVARDSDLRNRLTDTGEIMYLNALDSKGDIKTDPDGGLFDRNASYVKVSKDGSGVITYCVYLKGSKMVISNNDSCVLEGLINGDDAREYVNDI